VITIRDRAGYELEVDYSATDKDEFQFIARDTDGHEVMLDLTRIQAAGLQGYIVGLLSTPPT